MRLLPQRMLISRSLLFGLCILLMSGCAWNDAGQILYQSAISKQKFDCENDKVGTSIESCKQAIDTTVNASAREIKAQKLAQKNAAANAGFEPKDFVKKQLNRVTRSTQ